MSSSFMLQIELPRSRRNASLTSKSPGWSLMDLSDSSLPDDVHSPSLDINYDYTFPSFDNKMSSPIESAPMMKGDAFMDIETSHPLASMDYQSASHFVLGALRPVGEEALQSQSKPKLEEMLFERSPLDKVFPADEPKTEVVEPAKPLEPVSLPIVSAAPAVPAPIQLPAKSLVPPPEAKRPRRKAEAAKLQQTTYTKPVAAIFTATTADARDNEIVVGIYTRAERRAKILRYKQKRAKHVYIKGNQYECRRRFAVARPRVGGRFTKLKNLPEEAAAAAAAQPAGLEFAPSDD